MYENNLDVFVMDNGAFCIKAGINNLEGSDVCSIPSLIGYSKGHKILSSSMSRQEALYGKRALAMRALLALTYLMQRNTPTNWSHVCDLWKEVYHTCGIIPETKSLLLAVSTTSTKKDVENIIFNAFEKLEVPRLYICLQTVLALYGTGRVSGILVDCGECYTTCTPIYNGLSIRGGKSVMQLGGRDLTEYLIQLLSEEGYYMNSSSERDIVREIKESLCYVADTEQLKDLLSTDTCEQYILPDGQKISVDSERYKCPNLLFDPTIYCNENSLPELVQNVFYKLRSYLNIDQITLLKDNIVLVGGSSLFQNLGERLCDELEELENNKHDKFSVILPQNRINTVWVGGCILSQLTTFQKYFVDKSMYDEYGPSCLMTVIGDKR